MHLQGVVQRTLIRSGYDARWSMTGSTEALAAAIFSSWMLSSKRVAVIGALVVGGSVFAHDEESSVVVSRQIWNQLGVHMRQGYMLAWMCHVLGGAAKQNQTRHIMFTGCMQGVVGNQSPW